MATNYFLSKSFIASACLSIIVALAQPSIGNALTFQKGEKNRSVIQMKIHTSLRA